MSAANSDQCHTVRLPRGVRDELTAATGQSFSTLVRFMCMELLKRKRAERQAASTHKQEVQQEISDLPSPPGFSKE